MRVRLPNSLHAGAQMLRIGAIAGLLATAACGDKEPSGQTVATVNGSNITLSEVNIELAGANIRPEDRKKFTPQIIQAMIDRRLLAQEATKAGVEKNPNFVLQVRRAREIMLAQAALKRITSATGRTPTETDVNAYLAAHDDIGANRRILTVDQLRFASPPQQKLASFGSAKTLDALIAALNAGGIAFERGHGEIDTATLPAEVLAKLRELQPGEPLIVVSGPVAVANSITAVRPAPLGGEQAVAIARQRIAAESGQQAVKQQSESLRRSATISYATGYEPAKPGAAAAPAAR